MINPIKFIFAFAISIVLYSCAPKNEELTTDLVDIRTTASGNATDGKNPEMKFESLVHNFGKLSQGEKVTYAFKFKNIGGADLIISDARGSCGCTVPEYPRKAIAPGQESEISVQFSSEGKKGQVEKTVTITTNCSPNTKVITIQAEVLVPKEGNGAAH